MIYLFYNNMDKKYIDKCEDRYDVYYGIEKTLFSTKYQSNNQKILGIC